MRPGHGAHVGYTRYYDAAVPSNGVGVAWVTCRPGVPGVVAGGWPASVEVGWRPSGVRAGRGAGRGGGRAGQGSVPTRMGTRTMFPHSTHEPS